MRTRAIALSIACAVAVVACSDDEGSVEELCDAVRSDPSITTAFDGFDPSDVDGALAQLRAARVTLGELRDAAPSELRDELSIEIDYVQALVDGLTAMDSDEPANVLATVEQITDDHPGVDAAAATLGEFATTSCR